MILQGEGPPRQLGRQGYILTAIVAHEVLFGALIINPKFTVFVEAALGWIRSVFRFKHP